MKFIIRACLALQIIWRALQTDYKAVLGLTNYHCKDGFVTLCLSVIAGTCGILVDIVIYANRPWYGMSGFVGMALTIATITELSSIIYMAILARKIFNYCLCVIELDSEMAISTDHGESLAEVIYRLRYQLVEYLAYFYADRRRAGEGTKLSAGRTQIPRSLLRGVIYKDSHWIAVHNHPHSGCCGFSASDFASAVYYRMSKFIAISDKYVCTLELNEDCWKQISMADIEEYFERIHPKDSDQEIVALGMDFYSYWLGINKAAAEKFNMKFTVEKYKDSEYYKQYMEECKEKWHEKWHKCMSFLAAHLL